MFEKDIYVRRRAELKKRVGSGTLLFLGNDECGCNYADNTYPFRQDSTFLYYFGLPYDGLCGIDRYRQRSGNHIRRRTYHRPYRGWELSPLSTRKHISSESTMCVRRPISKAGSTALFRSGIYRSTVPNTGLSSGVCSASCRERKSLRPNSSVP